MNYIKYFAYKSDQLCKTNSKLSDITHFVDVDWMTSFQVSLDFIARGVCDRLINKEEQVDTKWESKRHFSKEVRKGTTIFFYHIPPPTHSKLFSLFPEKSFFGKKNTFWGVLKQRTPTPYLGKNCKKKPFFGAFPYGRTRTRKLTLFQREELWRPPEFCFSNVPSGEWGGILLNFPFSKFLTSPSAKNCFMD